MGEFHVFTHFNMLIGHLNKCFNMQKQMNVTCEHLHNKWTFLTNKLYISKSELHMFIGD